MRYWTEGFLSAENIKTSSIYLANNFHGPVSSTVNYALEYALPVAEADEYQSEQYTCHTFSMKVRAILSMLTVYF